MPDVNGEVTLRELAAEVRGNDRRCEERFAMQEEALALAHANLVWKLGIVAALILALINPLATVLLMRVWSK